MMKQEKPKLMSRQMGTNMQNMNAANGCGHDFNAGITLSHLDSSLKSSQVRLNKVPSHQFFKILDKGTMSRGTLSILVEFDPRVI